MFRKLLGRRDDGEAKPTRANLGEASTMYFDKELGRWRERGKEHLEEEEDNAPPPPMMSKPKPAPEESTAEGSGGPPLPGGGEKKKEGNYLDALIAPPNPYANRLNRGGASAAAAKPPSAPLPAFGMPMRPAVDPAQGDAAAGGDGEETSAVNGDTAAGGASDAGDASDAAAAAPPMAPFGGGIGATNPFGPKVSAVASNPFAPKGFGGGGGGMTPNPNAPRAFREGGSAARKPPKPVGGRANPFGAPATSPFGAAPSQDADAAADLGSAEGGGAADGEDCQPATDEAGNASHGDAGEAGVEENVADGAAGTGSLPPTPSKLSAHMPAYSPYAPAGQARRGGLLQSPYAPRAFASDECPAEEQEDVDPEGEVAAEEPVAEEGAVEELEGAEAEVEHQESGAFPEAEAEESEEPPLAASEEQDEAFEGEVEDDSASQMVDEPPPMGGPPMGGAAPPAMRTRASPFGALASPFVPQVLTTSPFGVVSSPFGAAVPIQPVESPEMDAPAAEEDAEVAEKEDGEIEDEPAEAPETAEEPADTFGGDGFAEATEAMAEAAPEWPEVMEATEATEVAEDGEIEEAEEQQVPAKAPATVAAPMGWGDKLGGDPFDSLEAEAALQQQTSPSAAEPSQPPAEEAAEVAPAASALPDDLAFEEAFADFDFAPEQLYQKPEQPVVEGTEEPAEQLEGAGQPEGPEQSEEQQPEEPEQSEEQQLEEPEQPGGQQELQEPQDRLQPEEAEESIEPAGVEEVDELAAWGDRDFDDIPDASPAAADGCAAEACAEAAPEEVQEKAEEAPPEDVQAAPEDSAKAAAEAAAIFDGTASGEDALADELFADNAKDEPAWVGSANNAESTSSWVMLQEEQRAAPEESGPGAEGEAAAPEDADAAAGGQQQAPAPVEAAEAEPFVEAAAEGGWDSDDLVAAQEPTPKSDGLADLFGGGAPAAPLTTAAAPAAAEAGAEEAVQEPPAAAAAEAAAAAGWGKEEDFATCVAEVAAAAPPAQEAAAPSDEREQQLQQDLANEKELTASLQQRLAAAEALAAHLQEQARAAEERLAEAAPSNEAALAAERSRREVAEQALGQERMDAEEQLQELQDKLDDADKKREKAEARAAELEKQVAASQEAPENGDKLGAVKLDSRGASPSPQGESSEEFNMPDFVWSCGNSELIAFVQKLVSESEHLKRQQQQSNLVSSLASSLDEVSGGSSGPTFDASGGVNADSALAFAASVMENDGHQIRPLMTLFEQHADALPVCSQVCAALENLTFTDTENRKAIIQSGGVEAILDMLRRFQDPSTGALLRPGIDTLWNLTFEDEAVDKATDAGAIELLAEVMRTHADLPDLQSGACAVLLNLATREPNRWKIVQGGVAVLIATAVQRHAMMEEVLEQGCQALYMLAYHPDLRPHVMASKGAEAARLAMESKHVSGRAQKWGKFLREVLDC